MNKIIKYGSISGLLVLHTILWFRAGMVYSAMEIMVKMYDKKNNPQKYV